MGNAVSRSVCKAFNAVKNTIANVFRRIAPPIIRYVVKHPIRTLFHIGSFILMVVPGVITGPLLAFAGFTRVGISAGSLAAAVQSGMGIVEAGGTFAVLQSAAMSGYGAVTVARAARLGVIAVEGVGHAVRSGNR